MDVPVPTKVIHAGVKRNELAERLACDVQGEILFDRADRGRYATDVSIYQMDPVGVLVPKAFEDVRVAVDICSELQASFVARGVGQYPAPCAFGPNRQGRLYLGRSA